MLQKSLKYCIRLVTYFKYAKRPYNLIPPPNRKCQDCRKNFNLSRCYSLHCYTNFLFETIMGNSKKVTEKNETSPRRSNRKKDSNKKQEVKKSQEKSSDEKHIAKVDMMFDDISLEVDGGITNAAKRAKDCFVMSHQNEESEGLGLVSLFVNKKRETLEMDLCAWIYSKESLLLPGERGLFAGRNFKKGETISVYCGRKVKENKKSDGYRLKNIQATKGNYELLCHYTNDISLSLDFQLRKYAKKIGSCFNRENCKYRFRNNSMFFGSVLKASRNISKDEEIFSCYNFDKKIIKNLQIEMIRDSMNEIEGFAKMTDDKDATRNLKNICEALEIEITCKFPKKKDLMDKIKKEMENNPRKRRSVRIKLA